MSSPSPATSAPWTISFIDSATSPNVDSLIRGWLNKQGFEDLANLSLDNLQDLIEFLSVNTDVAGVRQLLDSLKQLENHWNSSKNGQDKLSYLLDETEFQLTFIDILANGTSGVDGLDNAHGILSNRLETLKSVHAEILRGSLPWSEDAGSSSRESTVALLAKLDALKNAGFDLETLGLQDLYVNLSNAIQTYGTAIQAAGGDQKKANLASSQLRKSIAATYKEYYLSSGHSAQSQLVLKEQTVISDESTYQSYLGTPMDEDWRSKSPGTAKEDIDKAYQEAYRMYKDALDRGDDNAKSYFLERMKILRTTSQELGQGKRNTLVVLVEMYVDLLNLERVRLTSLKQKAFGADNQDLASKIQNRIERIDQLIPEILKGQIKLLEGELNLMASIPTR